MVERDLPGIEMEQLAAAQKAAIETSNQFTADGKPVRYIRTTVCPGRGPLHVPVRGWESRGR
jgi:hypothetical protein